MEYYSAGTGIAFICNSTKCTTIYSPIIHTILANANTVKQISVWAEGWEVEWGTAVEGRAGGGRRTVGRRWACWSK